MKEEFTAEFRRRLIRLRKYIEKYENGEVPASFVFSYLYSCASYCWCRKPIKFVKK